MDILNIILGVCTFVAGGSWIATYINLRTVKAQKKKAEAEAEGAKIENDSKIDDRYKELIEQITKSYEVIESNNDKTYNQMDKRITTLETETKQLKEDNQKKQLIIREALKCHIPNVECPVLLKQGNYDAQCNDCVQPNRSRKVK